jgi:hypothetical protein
MSALPLSELDRRGAPRARAGGLCVVVTADGPLSARLQDISATGAYFTLAARPALGTVVRLEHPQAGTVDGTVSRHGVDGVGVSFVLGQDSVAFALRAVTASLADAGER